MFLKSLRIYTLSISMFLTSSISFAASTNTTKASENSCIEKMANFLISESINSTQLSEVDSCMAQAINIESTNESLDKLGKDIDLKLNGRKLNRDRVQEFNAAVKLSIAEINSEFKKAKRMERIITTVVIVTVSALALRKLIISNANYQPGVFKNIYTNWDSNIARIFSPTDLTLYASAAIIGAGVGAIYVSNKYLQPSFVEAEALKIGAETLEKL